ncbi:biotin/lipoyl-containing protein [Oceanirhabdus sp. W0125-5]|uniref:biotin/lipoyl-containing protein n=1 Tax=Oceanirhabdus sp. W0125-5 TaxID=2999116 RepID=UPI0022F34050|nr:biotin/lipoyl-containing protein [Oceanirhabdus sp. W0125-5]WBW97090.1 biotin/lipoyl-binding protein [Oceanirhabdus sp. W0125-5]
MKKYRISFNGDVYELEVEEIGGAQSTGEVAVTKTEPVKAAAPKVVEKKEEPKKSAPTGGEAVTAPMPGAIIDVKVSEGQSVKAGDVVVILEAMKMENEIVAPVDGVVASINTSKGANVALGDTLVTIG